MLGGGGGRDGVPVLLLWDPHFHPGPLEINTRKIKNSQVLSFPFKSSSDTLIYPACAGKWARFSSPLHTPPHSVYFLLHAPSFLWLIQLLALTLLPVSRQQRGWKNITECGGGGFATPALTEHQQEVGRARVSSTQAADSGPLIVVSFE